MILLKSFKKRLALKLFQIFFLFFSVSLLSQSSDDLEFLDLLPDSQASSIAEKLGVQTGKPLNDEIIMEDFDEPEFESSVPKVTPLGISQSKELEITNFEDLSIFGLDFFKDSPNTFAPVDLAPAPQNYVLGPGDQLRIQLYGEEQINRVVSVNREGNIVIPEVGSIQVSGMTFNQAQNKILSSVEALLIGVNVDVSLTKFRSIQVFVLGNAFKPGAYTVSALSNISNILFFSGGPSNFGSLRNIEIKRNGSLIDSFDFYKLLIRGETNFDLDIQSNDAIVINPIGKTISIRGEVRKSSKFELKDDEDFDDLLNFSSGFSNSADINRITLSRIADNGERVFQNHTIESVKKIILKDGDDFYIHKLSNTPRNLISIIGETTATGSIAYEDGITLEKILKPKTFLPDTYTPFAIIERENSFGSKSLLKANLFNNDGPDTFLKPNDIIYILSKNDVDFLNSILVADALGLIGDESSKKISDYFNRSKLERFQCDSLKILAKQSNSSSITFVRSKYIPNPRVDPLSQLQFVDSCPAIFESKPYLIIFALENSSVLSGEIRNPGIYPTYKNLSAEDLLSFAGGRSDKSSGIIDIYTDNGISLQFDMEENDNLLELGITSSFYANLSSKVKDEVFSVSLEGAFVSPGVYGVKQGDKLSDVMKRAGGFKQNAYPYGGILARKSVAEKEKLAFLKSADQLEESIASAISSGRISSVGGDPSLALSSISGLISNLQDIDPIGRVVTEFDIDLLEKYPEKDLLLESGDRIFIPERSSTITVSGQVLSPTSFSFDPTLKVSNYIDLAGGFSEGADRSRTLVIYPNGRASRVKTWPNSPDLAPGTTLIIPRDPNPFDWLVFSQVLFPIISNFATSAAAIAALGNNN